MPHIREFSLLPVLTSTWYSQSVSCYLFLWVCSDIPWQIECIFPGWIMIWSTFSFATWTSLLHYFTFNTFIYLHTIKIMSHYILGSMCVSIIININIEFLYMLLKVHKLFCRKHVCACAEILISHHWNEIYFLVNLRSQILANSVVWESYWNYQFY